MSKPEAQQLGACTHKNISTSSPSPSGPAVLPAQAAEIAHYEPGDMARSSRTYARGYSRQTAISSSARRVRVRLR